MAQSFADVLAQVRKIFAWERLPEPPTGEPRRRAGPGPLRLMLGAEPLPLDPEPAEPRREELLAALFGHEELPFDPPAPGRARGPLSALFGRETLPQDPPAAPRRRSRWAAWLFAPERIDPS